MPTVTTDELNEAMDLIFLEDPYATKTPALYVERLRDLTNQTYAVDKVYEMACERVAKIKTLLPPELAALWPDRPDAVDIELAQTRHHRGGDPR